MNLYDTCELETDKEMSDMDYIRMFKGFYRCYLNGSPRNMNHWVLTQDYFCSLTPLKQKELEMKLDEDIEFQSLYKMFLSKKMDERIGRLI